MLEQLVNEIRAGGTLEIAALAAPGTRKAELLQRCGTPRETWTTNGVEVFEFWISTDRISSPFHGVISQFVVFLTNDHVYAWEPTGWASVGYKPQY